MHFLAAQSHTGKSPCPGRSAPYRLTPRIKNMNDISAMKPAFPSVSAGRKIPIVPVEKSPTP